MTHVGGSDLGADCRCLLGFWWITNTSPPAAPAPGPVRGWTHAWCQPVGDLLQVEHLPPELWAHSEKSLFSVDRTTNLTVAPQGGAVQLRAKGPQSSGDRLSQSKSMVLQEADLPQKPVRTHQEAPPRRGAALSFHVSVVPGVSAPQEPVPSRRRPWRRRWSGGESHIPRVPKSWSMATLCCPLVQLLGGEGDGHHRCLCASS